MRPNAPARVASIVRKPFIITVLLSSEFMQCMHSA